MGMAPDGHGGFWAISDSLFGTGRFWHYAHGTWSQPIRSPWMILGLASVPGAKAIWAISENTSNTVGLVILHGAMMSCRCWLENLWHWVWIWRARGR